MMRGVFKRNVRGETIYEEVSVLGFTSVNNSVCAIVSYGDSRAIKTSDGDIVKINPVMQVSLSDLEIIS